MTIDDLAQLASQIWGEPGSPSSRFEPADTEALRQLRVRHEAQLRPDLTHVHASWLLRALQHEPDSVWAVVAAHRPAHLAHTHDHASWLAGPAAPPPLPADPRAQKCVLGLWTERLVGDLPSEPDDPPVLAWLTAGGPDDARLRRLLAALGLAKLAYLDAGRGQFAAEFSARWASALERLARTWGQPRTAEWLDQAHADVRSQGFDGKVSQLSALGVLGLSRLLASLNPHRLRWVLQHLPYKLTRAVRQGLEAAGSHPVGLLNLQRWEQSLLDHAIHLRVLPAAARDAGEPPEASDR